jgi:hypothetical protein
VCVFRLLTFFPDKSTKLNCSHFNSELTQTVSGLSETLAVEHTIPCFCEQQARSETLARFIAGGVDVMVSTCLAARGLELQAQVVVYDFPPTIQGRRFLGFMSVGSFVTCHPFPGRLCSHVRAAKK